jgi:hypothetical protein
MELRMEVRKSAHGEQYRFYGAADTLKAWYQFLRGTCRLLGGTWSAPAFLPWAHIKALGKLPRVRELHQTQWVVDTTLLARLEKGQVKSAAQIRAESLETKEDSHLNFPPPASAYPH